MLNRVHRPVRMWADCVCACAQERPPPLPPSRAYTVSGGVKLGYPQQRTVAADWADDSGVRLRAGDSVLAVGAARRGHVAVQVCTLHTRITFPFPSFERLFIIILLH